MFTDVLRMSSMASIFPHTFVDMVYFTASANPVVIYAMFKLCSLQEH